MKQKVLKLTLNNSSLIELSGHSGDGMPFRIIGMLNIRKSLQSGFFLMFSSTDKVLKKLKKITQICLTYLTSLCYSKKCAIVESYAMILHEKLSHKALFRRFCDNRAFCGPQKK